MPGGDRSVLGGGDVGAVSLGVASVGCAEGRQSER